jgi:hypothetical protein
MLESKTMKVKGTWLTDYVKLIRANRDKNWDKYLEPADWEIINSTLLPSVWYPYETFNRTGKAVFHEIAKGNLEVTRAFGKMFADHLADIYQNILVPGNPAATIAKIYALQGSFFRDIPSVIVPVLHEKKRTVVKISVTPMERAIGAPEAFAYQFLGMLERILEKVGGRKSKVEIREVDNGYEIALDWE